MTMVTKITPLEVLFLYTSRMIEVNLRFIDLQLQPLCIALRRYCYNEAIDKIETRF